MDATPTTGAATGPAGLILARTRITAARARDAQPSDGGGTGKSDGND